MRTVLKLLTILSIGNESPGGGKDAILMAGGDPLDGILMADGISDILMAGQ